MRPRIKLFPSDRDESILMELWRWKFLTSQALHQKFFNGSSYTTSRVRLWELRRASLIECYALNPAATRFAWTLTERGFNQVKANLPNLKEHGFGSESPNHDFLTAAFHLGDWLLGLPAGAEVFTEQELRRINPDCFPGWVPCTQRRRPDGYSRIPIREHFFTFAFEIELTQKRTFNYRDIASFYNDHEEIDRIVWLVANSSLASTIEAKLLRFVGGKCMTHLFVTLPSFIKKGWQAEIVSGYEKGFPLSALIDSRAQRDRNTRCALDLLDTRKCPINSTHSELSKRASESDRISIIDILAPNTPTSQNAPSSFPRLPVPNQNFKKMEVSSNEKESTNINRSLTNP